MGNAGRYTCRLCLNDFIGDNEDIIISAMKASTEQTHGRGFFMLWYTSDEVSDSDIQRFCSDNEKDLQYIGTRIMNNRSIKLQDRVWFDITKKTDSTMEDRYRFRYVYEDGGIEELVYGIAEFSKAIDFFENKPERKPKYVKRDRR